MSSGDAKDQNLVSIDRLFEIADSMNLGHSESQSELVSVVIPCFGQLEYTRILVPSLLRHTGHPYELIFVDADSLDGTAEYLAGLQAGASALIRILQVRAQDGLAAYDAGIAEARGRFVVLLSNDTIVPSNWLAQLRALAEHDPAIGVVGPMSNYATPPQLVKAVPYGLVSPQRRRTVVSGGINVLENVVDSVDRFAGEWRVKCRGKWFETNRLDAFCLFFKRGVLETLAPLARWGMGTDGLSSMQTLDADSLCDAVRRGGWRLACCHDLFIHHFGSRQVIKMPRA